jgi:hypothetical protein
VTAELAELGRVTGLVLDAELARLRDVTAEVAAVRLQIAELDEALRDRTAVLRHGEGADCAHLAGRDGPWLDWVAARKRALNAALAEVAARREAQRVVARRAFGRAEALSGLLLLDDADLRQRQARRLVSDAVGATDPAAQDR